MNRQNVDSSERLLSLAVGVVGMASGARQGGVRGLLKLAGSAMLAKRGLTGHCQLKSLLASESTGTTDDASAQQAPSTRAASTEQQQEARMDNALEETFPASDPISP